MIDRLVQKEREDPACKRLRYYLPGKGKETEGEGRKQKKKTV